MPDDLGTLYLSQTCPLRAAKSVLLGYALYEKREGPDGPGDHVGFTDGSGAEEWLRGVPLGEIDHYTVCRG